MGLAALLALAANTFSNQFSRWGGTR